MKKEDQTTRHRSETGHLLALMTRTFTSGRDSFI